MKRIVSLFLIIVTIFSVLFSFPASAEDYVVGDIDRNNSVNIVDCLYILHHITKKEEFRFDSVSLTDINQDGEVTVADALLILQYCVDKIDSFENEDEIYSNVFKVEDTNIENYAYTYDKSADTSFVMDNVGLAKNTVYYVTFPKLTTHEYRVIYSFQGLLNRDFGLDNNHTTLLFISKDGSDPGWYNYVTKEGNYFENLNRIDITTLDDFYNTFKNQLLQCGYVLWDPKVPATANVALTICGVDGYIPVQAGTIAETTVKNLGMEMKLSLVDMFKKGATTLPGSTTPSSGSTKNDAYLWALEKYFDRCTADYLAYTVDGAVDSPKSPISSTRNAAFHCIENHDYIVARRMFVFDLSPYGEEAACDDPDQVIGTDLATLKKIFARRYERANGEFGQLMGFPPWWVKYCLNAVLPDGTVCGSMPATWIEWCFSETITCYNLAKEADAANPCSMTNGSFYYKYRIPEDFVFENNTPEEMTFDSNVYYFSIYAGDYDSSAWLKSISYSHWMANGGDANRGKIAINWAYNPNLSNRVPMVFQYVYENKSDNDYFVGGDSGAGYVIPTGLQNYKILKYAQMLRPPTYKNGLDIWADYCKRYYDLFDYEITGFIINGANPMNNKIFAAYNKFSPVGSFHNDGSKTLTVYNGVPYMYINNGIDQNTSSDTLYKFALATMDCNFSAYRTIAVSPTNIKKIVDNYVAYAAGKGKTVQYVDMYSLFSLVRQSGQGTIINE